MTEFQSSMSLNDGVEDMDNRGNCVAWLTQSGICLEDIHGVADSM
jgi:hypothetical protein